MSKFSLKRKIEEIVISDEDDREVTYELIEMSAANRDAYLQKLSSRIKTGPDGKPQGVSNFEGLQAELLGQCLTKKGKPVDSKEIQGWPAGVVTAIYNMAQEMNRLSEGEDAAMGTTQGNE